MVVAGSAGTIVAAACCVAISVLSGIRSPLDGVWGGSASAGWRQYAGGWGGKRGTEEAASGADVIGEATKSGDVDQSWAFMPVACSCVANCPAVECVCSCDTPEPKAPEEHVHVYNVRGWCELFMQPAVQFSWLCIGILCGLCGRCSVRAPSSGEAALPLSPARSLSGFYAGDVPSPDRRRAEALRSLPRKGRLA